MLLSRRDFDLLTMLSVLITTRITQSPNIRSILHEMLIRLGWNRTTTHISKSIKMMAGKVCMGARELGRGVRGCGGAWGEEREQGGKLSSLAVDSKWSQDCFSYPSVRGDIWASFQAS